MFVLVLVLVAMMMTIIVAIADAMIVVTVVARYRRGDGYVAEVVGGNALASRPAT